MTIRVLGPMDVGGPTLSPRERTVLAALIVRRDAALTAAELAEAIWGEDPPVTWPQQVRNAVARVRSRLGQEAIRTSGDSYRLGFEPGAIDAVQFEDLVTQSRRHGLEGAANRAVTGFERALALWGGEPLADVASWPAGQIEAARLTEVRANVEEELLDARLCAGERETVVPDAERLVREQPLRENRWALLALANYRADRQAQAIAVLRTARTRLSEDLGIDPSRTLTDLEAAVLRQDPALGPPEVAAVTATAIDNGTCPYRGLAPYDAADAAMFFGRDGDAEELVARCRPHAVVTITGPSGSGKSSLLRAGLVPRLRELGRTVEVITPDAAGIVSIRSMGAQDVSVLAIDQAEELLTRDADELRSLSQAAAAWVDDGGCLVLALRSDFLDRATALPAVGMALGRNVFAVPPLDRMMLRLAITGPAEHSGCEIEPGLLELVLRDAGDRPGILPALSHTLSMTWGRREGRTLTVAGYEATGGIAGAIAQSAEQVYESLSPAGQESCRGLMMRVIERTPDSSDVRRRVPLATLSADPVRRGVVERLVAARLMTIDGDSAIIAHEAVGATWPRLDQWLHDDAANAQMLRTVETAASAWDASGRADDDLLRGSRLEAAQEWRESASPDLTAAETAFLDESVNAHRAELRELEARAAHERTRNRRLRFALAAAAVLLVFAVVSGGIAAVRGADAEAAALDARIEALAATSLSVGDSDREVAALIAAEMYRRWPDEPRARSALLGAVTRPGGLVQRRSFPEGSFAVARLVPGTTSALVIVDRAEAEDRPAIQSVGLLDLETGAMSAEWDVPLPPNPWDIGRDVVVSEDGSVALVQSGALRRDGDPASCCRNYLSVIDINTGALRFDTVLLDARTGQKPVLTPDGSHAYLAHFVTGAPSMMDLETGHVTQFRDHDPDEFEGIPGRINGLALVEDRLYVGLGEAIDIYDANSLAAVGRIDLPGALSEILLFADGAGGLVGIGDDGGARIDLPSGDLRWRVGADSIPCVNGAVPSPGTFLCATGGGTVREHDLETGSPTGRAYESLTEHNRVVDVLPGGEEFITSVVQSPAELLRWRIDQMAPTTTRVADGQVLVEGFGRGRTLVITHPRRNWNPGVLPGGAVVEDSDIPPVQLWDVREDTPVGDPHDVLVWASDDVVARLDAEGPWMLDDLSTGQTYPLLADADSEVQWVFSAGLGDRGFALTPDAIITFDPLTGEPAPGTEQVPFAGQVMNMSEIPGIDRLAVTWWNEIADRDETTVFDLATGRESAHGLLYDGGTVGLPDGTILSTNTSRLLRSDDALVALDALAKPGGRPVHLDASHDGRTVLVVTVDQRLTLYDMRDGRRLGDEIIVPHDPDLFWPVGALGPDGDTLITTSADGLLLWDLRPAVLRDAACAMVGRQLTEIEWQTYMGDEPYEETCPAAS